MKGRYKGMNYIRSNEEKIFTAIIFTLLSLFVMPITGLYLICKKESPVPMRLLGIVLLMLGTFIAVKANGL